MKRSLSSSDNGLPLCMKESLNFITKSELCKNSLERCDMCDKVFNSKYNLILHNTKHMIIPLFHHPIYQCSECVSAYTSTEELKRHMLNKHLKITNKSDYIPEVLESFIKKEPYAVVNNDKFIVHETKLDIEAEEFLENFVKRQPITVLTKEPLFEEEVTNNLLKDFVRTESVALSPLVITIDDDSCDYSTESCEPNSNHRVRDRILFEDEDVDVEDEEDIISIPTAITTEITYCNANINHLGTIVNEGNKIDQIDKQWDSVHYDELMKPGVYKCKNCSKMFPHRYNLIMHEMVHVQFRKRSAFLCRYCDWYIGNDRWSLHRHQAMKHPNMSPGLTISGICSKCGLRYVRLKQHEANYHANVSHKCKAKDCDKQFQDREEFLAHLQEHKIFDPVEQLISKIVKVCDVCYMFLKNTARNQYTYLGVVQELGVRLRCQHCSKPFFELKLVRLIHRTKKRHHKKVTTNVDRLKNVQNRLKKLKFLNKF